MTGNDGQQYPPQDPAPDYWQQYPPAQEPYQQEPYQQDQYGQQYGSQYEQQQYQYQQPGYEYQEPQRQYTEPGYEYGYQSTQYDTGVGQYQYVPAQPVTGTQVGAPTEAPVEAPAEAPARAEQRPGATVPGQERRFGSDEFTFVDEKVEESEEVIDWMKFSETRGERRDERRRRIRTQLIALAVVLVLATGGTLGYLWANGKLFGAGSGTVAAESAREVIALHLHEVTGTGDQVSTALLISDPGSKKGTIMLVPGTLAIPPQSGGNMVQLASSVDVQGNAGIRTSLNTLLGSDVTATWGLYTPFLQVLVDHLQSITVDSNTTITQDGKALVSPGTSTLNGAEAIAYATYQAKGEAASAQLARFGQVIEAVIKQMPTDPTQAAATITQMGEVADPSLSDATLGAMLATLSKDANAGTLQVQTLPVSADGSLGSSADAQVQELLGGKVSGTGSAQVAARVGVVNASGVNANGNLASAAVINGGYTFVPNVTTDSTTQAASTISYTDDSRLADAKQLAEDLNLPATAVRKVTTSQNVDLLVVLGKDYHQG